MKIKELKEKNLAELKKILIDTTEKIRELNFKAANNQLKNVRDLRRSKKLQAQIKTLQKASELSEKAE